MKRNLKKSMKISDVSLSLGVPTSTLRYWDKEKLIQFERGEDNNYRRFSFQTMLDICDIMLFRSLELPIPTIKKMTRFDVDELSSLFEETKNNLENKIEYYQSVINKIERRKQKIKKYKSLVGKGISHTQAKLIPIYEFNFKDRHMVQMYLNDPSLSADILTDTPKRLQQCGLFLNDGKSKLLRAGDKHKRDYFYGLLWMNADGTSNAEMFKTTLKENHFQYGNIICRYLLSARTQLCDYRNFYEAWIEIKE